MEPVTTKFTGRSRTYIKWDELDDARLMQLAGVYGKPKTKDGSKFELAFNTGRPPDKRRSALKIYGRYRLLQQMNQPGNIKVGDPGALSSPTEALHRGGPTGAAYSQKRADLGRNQRASPAVASRNGNASGKKPHRQRIPVTNTDFYDRNDVALKPKPKPRYKVPKPIMAASRVPLRISMEPTKLGTMENSDTDSNATVDDDGTERTMAAHTIRLACVCGASFRSPQVRHRPPVLSAPH